MEGGSLGSAPGQGDPLFPLPTLALQCLNKLPSRAILECEVVADNINQAGVRNGGHAGQTSNSRL
eukprot:4538706-Alexandrium_andersonii.AAC.1